jgi:hypothetical protein
MKNSLLPAWMLAVLVATPASAHHSLAAYETSNYRTVQGTVKEFFWGNPHSTLTLAVEEPSGETTDWIFEGGSPGRLARGGFDERTIVSGDDVIVSYHRNRDNSIGGFFLAVTKENGDIFSLPRFHGLRKE